LSLGIDHTAIGIARTKNSLGLYCDVLGLEVTGSSENLGTEQEHLNNVFRARLSITSLKASRGLGLEFLEYLAPPGGRPAPRDIKPNDVVYWQTTLVANNLDALVKNFQKAGITSTLPIVRRTSRNDFGFSKVALIKDIDGHSLRLVER
jgi:hypothetical protein